MVCCATNAGGGKPLGQASAGKSAMNLFLMDFAAAPETCCAIIPLVRERKGSLRGRWGRRRGSGVCR
jgi:hypothetical protein